MSDSVYKVLKDDARMKEKDRITQEAYDNPLPGDYWNEMLVPYFVVLQVLGNGDLIVCDERIDDTKDHTWTWDLEKSKQVPRDYMKLRVRYQSLDGFVADVYKRCSHMWAVDAWNDLGRPFRDTTEKPVKNVKEYNVMFESILKDTIGTGMSSYTKKDMETMYNQIMYECIQVSRKHVLDKFGIKEPFAGTTEIEKALAEHFGVEEIKKYDR